jgi:type II secretory pathway pseudopilin PulG
MAGLLVAIGIMSILMSVAMPAWRTLAKREKEAELLFRGQQYTRAIDLYQRRFPGAYPTDIEMLVEERFLRRPYPDPMTGEPFRILTQGSAAAAAGETAAGADDEDGRSRSRLSDRAGRDGSGVPGSGLGGRAGRVSPGPFPGALGGDDEELGGIVGVVSRSTEESLRDYNGATRYDQWLFVHQEQGTTPGAAGTATPFPGGIGNGPGGTGGVGRAAGSLDGGLFRRPAGGRFGNRAGPSRPPGR